MKIASSCVRLTDVDLCCTSVAPYSESRFGGNVKVFIFVSMVALMCVLVAVTAIDLIQWSSAMRVW